jgi:hypothetical protein
MWSVPDLLRISESEHAWIVDGLLRRGSQMLLAAPPKSGKSLLASEIALSLSLPFKTGEKRFLFDARPDPETKFPGLEIKQPPKEKNWRVLFFSLEMREAEVSLRIRRQLGRFGLVAPFLGVEEPAPEELTFPLLHIFGLPDSESNDVNQDLQIVQAETVGFGQPAKTKNGDHFKALQNLVKSQNPDVVVYDTLIQLHGLNENDNIMMKSVMRTLRRLTVAETTGADGKQRTEPIAHIVLHHTRKESGQYRAQLSPEIMRGAGAVHGVADLVMLARQDYTPGVLEVHISSRSSFIPNFFLKREEGSLTHRWFAKTTEDKVDKASRVKTIILDLLDGVDPTGKRFDIEELTAAFAAASKEFGKGFKCGKETLQKRFEELCAEGKISIAKALKEKRSNAALKWEDCWFRPGNGEGEPETTFEPKPRQTQRQHGITAKGGTPSRKKIKKKKIPDPK